MHPSLPSMCSCTHAGSGHVIAMPLAQQPRGVLSKKNLHPLVAAAAHVYLRNPRTRVAIRNTAIALTMRKRYLSHNNHPPSQLKPRASDLYGIFLETEFRAQRQLHTYPPSLTQHSQTTCQISTQPLMHAPKPPQRNSIFYENDDT